MLGGEFVQDPASSKSKVRKTLSRQLLGPQARTCSPRLRSLTISGGLLLGLGLVLEHARRTLDLAETSSTQTQVGTGQLLLEARGKTQAVLEVG